MKFKEHSASSVFHWNTLGEQASPFPGRLSLSNPTNHYIYLFTVSTAVLATVPVFAVRVTLVVAATAAV